MGKTSKEKYTQTTLFKRIESEVTSYTSENVELSDGVHFSQHDLINRIYKFKNRDLSGSKINDDLSYNFYFDLISPRVDSEVKNLRFDTKHILVFSENPRKDFPAVFISNAVLDQWMVNKGEDIKLKASVEEFSANGNIGFKKVDGSYETTDPLNTYITNQIAETVDDTDIIERHEMRASQMKEMKSWDQDVVDEVIEDLGDKSFTATDSTTDIDSTSKRYEIFEYSGEVSEKEYNEVKGEDGGDENTYFLAKVIVAGLNSGGSGNKYILFIEKLDTPLSDNYVYAHRGRYEGRFWRVGMTELLFDHQIRANEIGNQLSRGLDWSSKSLFRSSDQTIMQNVRADLDNGDVIIDEDLSRLDTRMHGMDQLIADWNRVQEDADRVSNSYEIVRGESPPSGTPFRLGALIDANTGKLYVLLRQKITIPYRNVFKNWILPDLLNELKGEDIFTLTGEYEIFDQLREMMVDSWYVKNLVQIGPHTKEIADAIKAEKLDQIRNAEPIIENVKEIWKGVFKRLKVTITGENSDAADNITDMVQLLQLEQDPERIAFMLDSIYKIRGIPMPPKREEQPAETQIPNRSPEGAQGEVTTQQRQVEQPVAQ